MRHDIIECQQCVNNCWCSESDNNKKTCLLNYIIKVLVAFTSQNAIDNIATIC